MTTENHRRKGRWGRRSFLRAGAGGCGAAISLALAGCSEALPPLGRRVRYGRVETPDPGDPEYREWVPAASERPDASDADPGSVLYATPRRSGTDVVGQPLQFGTSLLSSTLDYFGTGSTHYDALIGIGPTRVATGEIPATLVADTLTGSGYEPSEPYAGFDCFERSDRPRTAAVRDGTIVWTQHGDGLATTRRATEAVIDAGAGRVPRQHEVDESFAAITSATGAWPFVHVGTNGVDPNGRGLTGSWSIEFDDTFVYTVTRTLFPDDATVTEAAVRDELETEPYATDARTAQVDIDGRLVTVTYNQHHSEYRDEFVDRIPPQITWGFEHDPDAGTLTLRHEAGDTADAGPFEVEVQNDGEWSMAATQFDDAHEIVVPGDAISLDLADHPGDRLRIGWNFPGTHSWTLLTEYDLP